MKLRMFQRQMTMGLTLFFRNRAGIFWTLAFPLLLLVAFGFIFRNGPAAPGSRVIWTLEGAESAEDAALRKALSDEKVVVDQRVSAQVEAEWKEGKVPLILERAEGGLRMRINAYTAMQGMQSMNLVQQAYLISQARGRGQVDPKKIPYVLQSPGKKMALNYVEFLLPGLLGLNLLMMGLYAVGAVNVTNREKGTYRRLSVTPLPKSVFLSAQISIRLVIVAMQAILLMGVGRLVFGVQNQGSYAQIVALLFMGTCCFISFGYALSSLVKGTEAYMGLAQLFFMGMMLLGGVYFSLDAAPKWMQGAVQIIPMTPLLKMMRAVFNDGGSILDFRGGLMVLMAWTVISFAVAVKRFEWA